MVGVFCVPSRESNMNGHSTNDVNSTLHESPWVTNVHHHRSDAVGLYLIIVTFPDISPPMNCSQPWFTLLKLLPVGASGRCHDSSAYIVCSPLKNINIDQLVELEYCSCPSFPDPVLCISEMFQIYGTLELYITRYWIRWQNIVCIEHCREFQIFQDTRDQILAISELVSR